MKLSEAIKKGSDLVGETRGSFAKKIDESTYCCPIGTALAGVAGLARVDSMGKEEDYYFALKFCGIELLEGTRFAHPIVDEAEFDIFGIVIDLTDKYGWSRDSVIRWLESIGA